MNLLPDGFSGTSVSIRQTTRSNFHTHCHKNVKSDKTHHYKSLGVLPLTILKLNIASDLSFLFGRSRVQMSVQETAVLTEFSVVSFSPSKQTASFYILTYLLSPRSTVLLEKLTGFQLLKKFHAFYVTKRSITAFTIARHLSLSYCLFVFGATTPRGPGPPHSRSF